MPNNSGSCHLGIVSTTCHPGVDDSVNHPGWGLAIATHAGHAVSSTHPQHYDGSSACVFRAALSSGIHNSLLFYVLAELKTMRRRMNGPQICTYNNII